MSVERIHPVSHGTVQVYPTRVTDELGQVSDAYYSTGSGPVKVVQGNSGALQFDFWYQPQPTWSAVRYSDGVMAPNRTGIEVKTSSDTFSLEMNDNDRNIHYLDSFGFGVISAVNRTHLQYKSHSNTNSTILTDTFWIIKRV